MKGSAASTAPALAAACPSDVCARSDRGSYGRDLAAAAAAGAAAGRAASPPSRSTLERLAALMGIDLVPTTLAKSD
jgi:hypothetical protein